MEYKKIKAGKFIKRPNRFVAYVEVDGKEEMVHVKNTGRCKELLIESATVLLEESDNRKRKTKYSIIAVYKGDLLINMDSQAPNAVAAEALKDGTIKEIGLVDTIKREVVYGNSRFDLYYEKGDERGFIEVKGVTLEENGKVLFPDAPTERGTKHLNELIMAVENGYQCAVLFVVQLKGAKSFQPNKDRDPLFAQTLKRAKEKGVKILAYDCNVSETTLELNKSLDSIII